MPPSSVNESTGATLAIQRANIVLRADLVGPRGEIDEGYISHLVDLVLERFNRS